MSCWMAIHTQARCGAWSQKKITGVLQYERQHILHNTVITVFNWPRGTDTFSVLKWAVKLSWERRRHFEQNTVFWWSPFSFRRLCEQTEYSLLGFTKIQRLLKIIPYIPAELSCAVHFPILTYQDPCKLQTQSADQVGWCKGNDLGLYSGGALLQSRLS
jgi:hypothetical protein